MIFLGPTLEIHTHTTIRGAGARGQREREEEGAEKLFGILPDDLSGEFCELWDEFEDAKTPEALFAVALDRIQGFSQNCISRGKS